MNSACTALAPLARDDQLIITRGNGPQVGVALESAGRALYRPYPFDALGAQTQGLAPFTIDFRLCET